MKKSKQGAPGSVRPFASAGKGPAGVMNSLPRARTRVVGLGSSPTEILKESLLDLPRTRARGGTKPQALWPRIARPLLVPFAFLESGARMGFRGISCAAKAAFVSRRGEEARMGGGDVRHRRDDLSP